MDQSEFKQEYFGEFPQIPAKEWEVRRELIAYKIATERFDRSLPHLIVNGVARVLPEHMSTSEKFARKRKLDMQAMFDMMEVDQKTIEDARRFVENSISRHHDKLNQLLRLRQSLPGIDPSVGIVRTV